MRYGHRQVINAIELYTGVIYIRTSNGGPNRGRGSMASVSKPAAFVIGSLGQSPERGPEAEPLMRGFPEAEIVPDLCHSEFSLPVLI